MRIQWVMSFLLMCLFAAPEVLDAQELVPTEVDGRRNEESFSPIPVEVDEGQANSSVGPHETPKALTEVVPFDDDVDPFAALPTPTKPQLSPEDPRGDTLRLVPAVPPELGEVIASFPPEVEPLPPVKAQTPELLVVRYSPEGSSDTVGAVTATFNQPMISLSTVERVAANDPPMTIEPTAEGSFVWLGTETLAFEAKERMPFGNEYTVTIPKGTRSALGKSLKTAHRWKFETPRPRVESASPYDSETRVTPDAHIVLRFNAPVTPQVALRNITLKDEKNRRYRLKWLKNEDIKASENPLVAAEQKVFASRTLTFQPTKKLPLATRFTLTVGPKLTCTEGPLPAGETRKFSFSTYYPLKINKISCHWEDEDCYPGSPVNVEFNNSLESLDYSKLVTITPKPADLDVRVSGSVVSIRGVFEASKEYRLKVAKGFKDIYGQSNRRGSKKTVKYRPAEPWMTIDRAGVAVVEAKQELGYRLTTMNISEVKVRLARVDEKNLGLVQNRLGRYYGDDEAMESLEVLTNQKVKLPGKINALNETRLDLRPGVNADGYGWMFLEVRSRVVRGFLKWDSISQRALIQVTNLGITAGMSEEEIVVLVSQLDSGAVVKGATVRFTDQGGKVYTSGTTDGDGMVKLKGPEALKDLPDGPYVLVAEMGPDRAFLFVDGSGMGGYVSSFRYRNQTPKTEQFRGLVFTDRGAYRPTEKVSLQFMGRKRSLGPDGDILERPMDSRECNWKVTDPRGNKVADGKMTLTPFATGSFQVQPAKNAPLGYYQAEVVCAEGTTYGNFQVQEYRTPEYKTSVQWKDTDTTLLMYRELVAQVLGEYYFGAKMAGADVEWALSRTSSPYTPPNNPGFYFSDIDETQQWRGRRRGRYRRGHGFDTFASGTGTLNSQGTLLIPAKLDPGSNRTNAASFTLEAQVFDRNRQSIASRASVLAHWAERYVGIRLDRFVVAEGESVQVTSVVTRISGERYADADVDVALIATGWEENKVENPDGTISYDQEHYKRPVGSCKISATEKGGTCRLTVEKAGTYIVRATTYDKAGRPNFAALTLYAYGKGRTSWRQNENLQVEMVPDKKVYEPGDSARILVRSPFDEASGFAMVSREGLVSVVPLKVENGTDTFEVPIEAHRLPNLMITIALVRGRTEEAGKTETDSGRPMFAWGNLDLSVNLNHRKIDVLAKPDRSGVVPGEEVTIRVTTKDHSGKPVDASVALMVVDEGVLALTGYSPSDPLTWFYPKKASGTVLEALRPLILPRPKAKPKIDTVEVQNGAKEERMMVQRSSMNGSLHSAPPSPSMERGKARQKSASTRDGSDRGENAPQFGVREVFESTAYYDGDLRTGKDGEISVKVKMPDNLTQFRIIAVAADSAKRFGMDDDQVRTRRKLVLRPSLPRFANLGDQFRASVVVNNETGRNTDVLVKLSAYNVEILSDAVKTVSVPQGEAREVWFEARPKTPGPAVFQFGGVALTRGRETDAASVVIPVLIPATAEAFATYGVVGDDAVGQPIEAPTNVLPEFGGLDVSLSSTALTGLQDAMTYVFEYPYECTEQLCSRILPILALEPILADFGIGGMDSPAKARSIVEAGLKTLLSRQRGDGGFGYWSSSHRSYLYLTAYAAVTLVEARQKGYEVSDYVMNRIAKFLEQRLDAPYEWEKTAYGSQTMAVLALVRMGRNPTGHIKRLYGIATNGVKQRGKRVDVMSLFAKAWLLEAIHRVKGSEVWKTNLLRILSNGSVETASAIHFAEGKRESLRLMMHSEERTDAIVLGTLIEVDPKNSMIPKIVRGLIRGRINGRWSTTQANAYALLGLGKYYEKFEADPPDFIASLWFDKVPVLGWAFKGRSMDIVKTRVPMKKVLEQAAGKLILSKKGAGRLYYRLGLRYAPSDLKLEKLERGFSVERTYSSVEGADNVSRTKDGTWTVKAGTYVKVNLRVIAPDRRYYVAVVDPMPAGFEAVNEGFQTSAKSITRQRGQDNYPTFGRPWWWWNPWDFEERRDDRVQLFMDRMVGGIYTYSYITRATAVGDFVVPPTRAEEMYEPETFGRTETTRVIVTP